MEKTILHIYTDSPSFSKQELKLKLTTKISKTEKLLQFKLFQEKWTHNTYYKSDLCGGLQLVPSLTSDTVAGKSPLAQSWSQITYGQTNIKIFTVHVLLLERKPGLFASVTLPWTPLFLSQLTHLCGMCFCVLKKQLLSHPRFRCSLWILPPSPQGVLLVQTDFGVKCCSVPHYEKPVSVSYSHLNHAISAPPRGGSPWNTAGIWALPNLKAQAAPADPWEVTAPWHR